MMELKVVTEDGLVEDRCGQLKVGVGIDALGVVLGEHGCLDIRRKGRSPEKGQASRAVNDSAHTGLGCIGGAQIMSRLGWEQFTEVCRPSRNIQGKSIQILKVVTGAFSEADPVARCLCQGLLQLRKQARSTGNGEQHTAKLAQQFLTLPDGNALLMSRLVKNFEQTRLFALR